MTEILSPAGSAEALQAALRCGCDAVYLGGETFSARANATNFTNDELKAAVSECHRCGAKVYQAINTVVFDYQLDECCEAVKFAAEIGIDGLITQDLCLVEIVKKCCPSLEIHASTQMTVHTENGVEMTKELGFSRAVLARELPLDIIEHLSHLGTETEVFVHGALCMSVSGQCFMSAVIGSRSANRGLCGQACRLPVSAFEGKERYDLSLKDLSYLKEIKLLEKAGVSSLKIEGRMKRPEYVAKATDSCKKALNDMDFDLEELEAVFSRSGFTDGYLKRQTGRDMFGTRVKENVNASAKILPRLHELYRHEGKRSTIDFVFTAQKNEPCTLAAKESSGCTAFISGEAPQPAQTRGTDEAVINKHLSKLGDTIYSLGSLECDIDDMLWISPAGLNDMRRKICEELDRKRIEHFTKAVEFTSLSITDFEQADKPQGKEIRIEITDFEQLDMLDMNDIELVIIPLGMFQSAFEKKLDISKIALKMPRFTFDEPKQINRLLESKKLGFSKIIATNLAHIKSAKDCGFEIHTDFGFNITNSCALNVLKKLDVKDAVVSFEMKYSQINSLKKSIPVGIFGYGRLPLMLTANCPVSQAAGCRECTKMLYDRTGRTYNIKCSKAEGYVEILNSEILFLADKLDDFSDISFVTLSFTDETPHQVKDIISAYKTGYGKKPSLLTRGLYYRGVK